MMGRAEGKKERRREERRRRKKKEEENGKEGERIKEDGQPGGHSF